MFKRPLLTVLHNGSVTIHVESTLAKQLLADLRKAGFECEVAESDFSTSLVGGKIERITGIDLPNAIDQAPLRRFLRSWQTRFPAP
jgi:hypothetical protein